RHCGDEVDVVSDPYLARARELIVQHVVDDPVVARLVCVAVAGREVRARLLFTGREELHVVVTGPGRVPARDVHPHTVVQMDDIDRGDTAVGETEVRADTDDVAVLLRLRDRAREGDVVLAWRNRKRSSFEMETRRPHGDA